MRRFVCMKPGNNKNIEDLLPDTNTIIQYRADQVLSANTRTDTTAPLAAVNVKKISLFSDWQKISVCTIIIEYSSNPPCNRGTSPMRINRN